ncbi:MerR family transcriptional regulator [Caulobacter segnis]|uniref:Transcriptional regulator, MerR family n=2 Tax=Caulobacter segnis TaxID=88688 RepID=D5VNN4_CAUST|nr:MerR family transcriptional regulator [Caulobacter segnis]ADG12107.1 transcriptional regulator, MerR family [Caulobacter segnis ATCC 21756]AVQ03713.1 MerR family transcriptional regulator [Caulobacter segnis]
MSVYTVKQMAKLSGVSVRALHHYDAIGLLRPRAVGANGYRYYDRQDLLRLQQILFHRTLETPLKDIQAVLDDPRFDLAAALRAQRERLAAEAERYARLVTVVDQTLATLEGDETMDDKMLFEGFDPKKQAQHEAWLVDRYGDEAAQRIADAKAGMKTWGKKDWSHFQEEAKAIEHDLAKALSQGLPVDSEPVTAIMRRHWAWVGRSWNREPTPDAFKGLGHLYQENPEFTARYEAIAPGLTEYLAEAMRVFADKR